MKAPKVYTISPSELSYRCDHCAHLKHNYELQNKGVSAGITGELDSIQKKYFLFLVKRTKDIKARLILILLKTSD